MDYKRFKQLWDALITKRPIAKGNAANGNVAISNGMSKRTSDALIAYARGDKSAFQAAKKKLSTATA